MSIPSYDGLDTKFYLVPTTTTVTAVSDIETAIATAKEIQNIVTFGDFDLGTYAVNTLSVFGGGMIKSLGAKTVSNIASQIVFDAANATGQAEISTMHGDKTRRILIVQLNDNPTSGVSPHPSYLVVQIAVSALTIPIAMDSSYVYNATLELMEIPLMHKAAGTTV